MIGRVAGFCVGLLIDLALMQTLGVTSLTFTIIGYWAGRLRELRDPQAALTPLFVGAAAASAAMVGYSIIEFLLGVDAPVSLELLREIVVGVLVDTALALPFWALVRRCLVGALPDDPRRRRRRAYTTGGLSPLSRAQAGGREPADGSRSKARHAPIGRLGKGEPRLEQWQPSSPPARIARWRSLERRAGHVRDHLLSPVVPAGAERRTVRPEGPANDQRELAIPAPRGEILASGQPIVTSEVTNAVQILPSSLPHSVQGTGVEYQEQWRKPTRNSRRRENV